MFPRLPSLKSPAARLLALAALLPAPAQAHVKWFCAFDVAGAPVGLENVLCRDFEQLISLSLVLLLAGRTIEGTPLGAAWLPSMLSRRTLPFASLGILVLFGIAVGQHGLFHLLDYPVFWDWRPASACNGFRSACVRSTCCAAWRRSP